MKARHSPKRVQKVAREPEISIRAISKLTALESAFCIWVCWLMWFERPAAPGLALKSQRAEPQMDRCPSHLCVRLFTFKSCVSEERGERCILYTARALVAICALAVFAASSWESYFPRFRIQRGPTLFPRARNVVQHEVHEMRSIICSVHFIVIWRRPRSERDEPPPRSRCITYCGANALPNVCRRWNYTRAAAISTIWWRAPTSCVVRVLFLIWLWYHSLHAADWLSFDLLIATYERERSKVLQRKWRLDRDLLYNG